MHFIPLTGTQKHTSGRAEPVKPIQVVPRCSMHDLICLFFFLYSCLYFQCLSFWNPPPSLCLLLPNSGNPPLCTQRADMEYCHETEARAFLSAGPRWGTLARGAGASTGVRGQGTNERLSVRAWWRHVGILSDGRAAIVSVAMLSRSKRRIAPLNQLEMLARSSWKAFLFISRDSGIRDQVLRHHTPHDRLQSDAAFFLCQG